jgi:hypothetical protein
MIDPAVHRETTSGISFSEDKKLTSRLKAEALKGGVLKARPLGPKRADKRSPKRA